MKYQRMIGFLSSSILVKKKGKSMRFCVDYRRLNTETQMRILCQDIDDILHQIGQAKYITTLDLARGYWQVPVDCHQTAHLGYFRTQWSTSNILETYGSDHSLNAPVCRCLCDIQLKLGRTLNCFA